VYDGRTLLGYLIDEHRQCVALTDERALIGMFPDRTAPANAIFKHPGQVPAQGA
jgi:hypothetical protein